MSLIEDIPKQLKAFFSTFPWKNVLLFSIFLMVAFVFWLMLFFRRENVEGHFIVPIKFVNVADDEVFNMPPPDFIEVWFQDEGVNIFRYSISQRDTLVIDVASFRERGIAHLHGPDLQFLIRQLFPTVQQSVLSDPVSISLEMSQLQSRELPVVFDGEITTNRANLIADTVRFTPKTVMAFGTQQALDELQVAATEFVAFRNLRATSQLPVAINPVEGIRFVPNEVEIYISVAEFTQRSIEIPITAINLPEHLSVKFFPSRVTVSFSVTLEEYRRISSDDLAIVLDYRNFAANENGRVALALTNQPASILNPRLSPTSVEFLFENRQE